MNSPARTSARAVAAHNAAAGRQQVCRGGCGTPSNLNSASCTSIQYRAGPAADGDRYRPARLPDARCQSPGRSVWSQLIPRAAPACQPVVGHVRPVLGLRLIDARPVPASAVLGSPSCYHAPAENYPPAMRRLPHVDEQAGSKLELGDVTRGTRARTRETAPGPEVTPTPPGPPTIPRIAGPHPSHPLAPGCRDGCPNGLDELLLGKARA
ncbi:hypothetical protein MAPG_10081 [Magnaporthiopsis poae ATCC 64411]|uniref:Uncharacterized protein n=1 Tax=Magnaporthiopsis poae (strain ATCC 64411 / 73-15) TaxID=644358 RepID=A0A0C4EBM9_MAGP6|nr:hypothetical protein MAPG_10081 [Magnaporthiopsis poae ATCC 64411]